jgi:hypothetical protein
MKRSANKHRRVFDGNLIKDIDRLIVSGAARHGQEFWSAVASEARHRFGLSDKLQFVDALNRISS